MWSHLWNPAQSNYYPGNFLQWSFSIKMIMVFLSVQLIALPGFFFFITLYDHDHRADALTSSRIWGLETVYPIDLALKNNFYSL